MYYLIHLYEMQQFVWSKKKQIDDMFDVSEIFEENAHTETSKKDKEALQALKMHPCLYQKQESIGHIK